MIQMQGKNKMRSSFLKCEILRRSRTKHFLPVSLGVTALFFNKFFFPTVCSCQIWKPEGRSCLPVVTVDASECAHSEKTWSFCHNEFCFSLSTLQCFFTLYIWNLPTSRFKSLELKWIMIHRHNCNTVVTWNLYFRNTAKIYQTLLIKNQVWGINTWRLKAFAFTTHTNQFKPRRSLTPGIQNEEWKCSQQPQHSYLSAAWIHRTSMAIISDWLAHPHLNLDWTLLLWTCSRIISSNAWSLTNTSSWHLCTANKQMFVMKIIFL